MNLGVWNKLPKDMQDVFTQASLDALKFSAEMWARREPEELAKLKQAGVKFHPASEADQAAWNAHTRTLLNEWLADMDKTGKGDAARRMVALVDEIKAKYPN
jgi:TRAP-type C4-dicarboxylate transport system substrate-binding protein